MCAVEPVVILVDERVHILQSKNIQKICQLYILVNPGIVNSGSKHQPYL